MNRGGDGAALLMHIPLVGAIYPDQITGCILHRHAFITIDNMRLYLLAKCITHEEVLIDNGV